MYVIAFLDRSNVSFAQKEFEIDFGISAASYAFGAGLFFVGYAIFEVPSNILLHKVGARWWLARIMVSWGIVAACFVFVQGETSFYILRFLLGVAEAGFFPGVILFLTYWIPARHLSRARGFFYMGIALAGILGNPLSGGLLELNGVLGLRGIQWMFLVEGLLAVVVGIWAYFYLTDHPKDAGSGCRRTSGWRWRRPSRPRTPPSPKAMARRRCWPRSANWRVWYFALIYFCLQIAVYGVTFFLPTQVTAITGQKLGFQASLVTAIPWVFGLAAVAFFPGLADRTRKHRTIGCALLARDRLRDHHLGRIEQLPGVGHRRPVPGGHGVRGHVADLLDPADRVHDRIRGRRGHRPDQLPGQPGRVPGPHPARRLQGGVRRQCRPVRPLRGRVCLRDPVRPHVILQEGQRGRGRPPGRGGRGHDRGALNTGPATTTVAISLKMYFSNARTRDYCAAVAQFAEADDAIKEGRTELVVLPTFPSIPSALSAVQGSNVRIGAQDLAGEDAGAFTGEVSGAELAELGCTHAEVGHAERRTLFGESDSVVAAKTRAAFRHGLTPILCVGEETRSDPPAAADVCVRQVLSALSHPSATRVATPHVIVAYEPYWAIGAQRPAPTGYVADVCELVRTALADELEEFAIIYGGSAGPGLLSELQGSVDGLFLGRFAHDPKAVAGVLTEASARR